MITVSCFGNKHVALFGLGGSGIATAHALIQGGAKVTAFDDNAPACEQAKAAGIAIADLRALNWQEIAALILSPGIPLTHPAPHWAAALARQNGCAIIGDVELFARERANRMKIQGWDEQDCPLIAITGTNGKSTTTALIAHLLRASGRDVQMGGNIGTPILALEKIKKGRCYVIECSSYQIDLAPSLKPTISVLTNITPDHIDRHGTFARYAGIKEQLVTRARQVIMAIDDETSRTMAGRVTKPVMVSTRQQLDEGWFFARQTLFKAHDGRVNAIASLEGIASLRGHHNGQNALLAVAACEALERFPKSVERFSDKKCGENKKIEQFVEPGKTKTALEVDISNMQTALADFHGLAHRMEQVGRLGSIVFINDSKATNAQATAPALAAFGQVYWIVGGVAKEGGIDALKPFFDKIRKAYLIGEAALDFHATIDNAVPNDVSGTLEKAVIQATQDAMADIKAGHATGEVAILLSPACASFDQFANYSARGDAFRHLVHKQLNT